MKKIEHRYFGQLNLATTDDVEVIWEKEIQGIDTCLWFDKNGEPAAGILDLYARFLENIDDKIKEARKALIAYLKDDSCVTKLVKLRLLMYNKQNKIR